MKTFLLLLARRAHALCERGHAFPAGYPDSACWCSTRAKGQLSIASRSPPGTPMAIRLSTDHKKIYVTTIDHNGIEVIDVATRKVINHFVLNTPTKQYRF